MELLERHLKAGWELARVVTDAVRQGVLLGILEQPPGSQRLQFRHGLLGDYFSSRQLLLQQSWFEMYLTAARMPHHFRAIAMSGFDEPARPIWLSLPTMRLSSRRPLVRHLAIPPPWHMHAR